ncbi:hypothetical protein BDB01DRAFT_781534 [Pilobolus umbonatus]|nr:hypothetical protein BDB01DRAFT_781534 [Pilobolus umbonatus]
MDTTDERNQTMAVTLLDEHLLHNESSKEYSFDDTIALDDTMDLSEDNCIEKQLGISPNFLSDEHNSDENYLISDNDPYSLASKTFYITCHKISRQNNPSYRKRPPYTFLENWLIHNVFSKSQQILLRFPVIHPRVMMTEGDFIYTPQQYIDNADLSNDIPGDQYYMNGEDQLQYREYNEEEEEEEAYDYYDETFFIGDEGVVTMSASAPDASHFMSEDDNNIHISNNTYQNDYSEYNNSNINHNNNLHSSSLIMDENTWMGHSRYNNNNLTLHVVNPDTTDEDTEDRTYRSAFSSTNPYLSIVNTSYRHHLQAVEEEEEEEEEVAETMDVDYHQIDNRYDPSDKEDRRMEDTIQPMSDHHPLAYGLSMSPEVIKWYRSVDTRTETTPLSSENPLEAKSYDDNMNTTMNICNRTSTNTINNNNNNNNNNALSCNSSNSSNSSHSSSHSTHRTDMKIVDEVEKPMTRRSMDSYQSLADIMMTDDIAENNQSTNTSYGTLLTVYHHSELENKHQSVSVLMQVSTCLVDAAFVAMDLAQNYSDNSRQTGSLVGFVSCVFRIWKTFFLGAESMLGWNTYESKLQTII